MVLPNLFPREQLKRVAGLDVCMTEEMHNARLLWARMFEEKAPWLGQNTQSLGLPAAIAAEHARLVTVEMQSEITGSPRADFLQEAYKAVLERLRVDVEIATACGGMVFKPFVADGRLCVDCVPAWRFFPTNIDSSGAITGAAFVEQCKQGERYYTRVEEHSAQGTGYQIQNRAYCSYSASDLGTACQISAVPAWADMEQELTIQRADGGPLGGMLFAQFMPPLANNIDSASAMGLSVYSRATGLIEQADKQYSRILWEYEGSELAIDVSEGALRSDAQGLDQRRERLYRQLGVENGSGGDLYQVFSPAIRDSSLFHGLDKLLKRIEFNCFLSYGTLSDPQAVDKTAEEVRSSKQRSYSAVCDMQKSLQAALEHLVWCLDQYTNLYQLAPAGSYALSCTWGDGIMENTDIEFARRMQLASSGFLRPELLLSWYLGISEEEAKAMMPPAPAKAALFEEE